MIVLGQRPEVARRGDGGTWLATVSLPRGEDARSSPAPRRASAARSRRSSRARARPSSSATARARTRRSSSRRTIGGARGAGRRLVARRRAAARRGGGRRRRARQQRRPDARRPARAHVRRRLAHRDRHQPQLGLLHLPRGDAADDEEARRARSSTSARSSACTATGARRTTPRRRRGSSASRSRSRASSGRANVRANVVAPGYVKTQLTEVLPEEATEAMIANTPLGRVAEPDDVAGAVRFLAPTRPRSSRARCCSSTADWGCDERERTTARGDHRARHGQPARQRRADVVVAPARGRVRRGRDHRVRPHATTTSTSPAS